MSVKKIKIKPPRERLQVEVQQDSYLQQHKLIQVISLFF